MGTLHPNTQCPRCGDSDIPPYKGGVPTPNHGVTTKRENENKMDREEDIEQSRKDGEIFSTLAMALIDKGHSESAVAAALLDTAANVSLLVGSQSETATWLHSVAQAIDRGDASVN